MRSTRITTAIAATVVAVGLSACGGSTSGTTSTRDLSGAQRIVAGYDAARSDRSVRMEGEISVRTSGRDLSVPLDGAIDFTNDAARFDVSLAGLGLPAVGDGSLEARVVDGRLYVRVGDLVARLLGGASWIDVPVDAMGAGPDPTGFLDALRGVVKVERVGTDTIRGVEATHYRGTVSLESAIARAPESRREALRRALGDGTGTLPVDVWVDGQDRPVRFVAAFDTDRVAVDVRLDLFDYEIGRAHV